MADRVFRAQAIGAVIRLAAWAGERSIIVINVVEDACHVLD